MGPKAKELFEDAQALLEEIIRGELLPRAGCTDSSRPIAMAAMISYCTDGPEKVGTSWLRFHTLRQQMEKPAEPNHNLAS